MSMSDEPGAAWIDREASWRLVIAPAFVAYAGLLALLGELKVDAVVVIGAFLVIAFAPRVKVARKPLLPFFAFGVIYDSMRLYMPTMHRLIPVNVESLYRAELALFGIRTADGRLITPPELFITHTHVVVDVVAAVAYFLFTFLPWAMAIYLLFKNRPVLTRYGWAWLAATAIAIVIYILYPAAPPWYVEQHGFAPPPLDLPGNPARLAAVDELLGVPYFATIYSRNANVFGAMPSMHAGFPLLAFLYARLALGRWRYLFLVHGMITCFSAIYLRHHYILDVIAGVFVALAAFQLTERAFRRLQR